MATPLRQPLRHFEGEQDPYLTNRWKGQEEGTHPSFGQIRMVVSPLFNAIPFFSKKTRIVPYNRVPESQVLSLAKQNL